MVDEARGCALTLLKHNSPNSALLDIAFHNPALTAKPTFDIFRAIVVEHLTLTKALVSPEDQVAFNGVLSLISGEYNELVSLRNTLLHGTWFVGYSSREDPNAETHSGKIQADKEGLEPESVPKHAFELLALKDRGTRPFQTIPFQWSLHTIDREGVLNHAEFLADGVNDPRRQFAETLIDALAYSNGPIIVYSAYEKTRLKELAAEFPDLGTELSTVITRLADLLPIVRSAVYFPEFEFSNSIKSVAPALCPGFSYDDLDGVADGGAASAAFLQLASGRITDPGEAVQLRAALLAYCKRDTLAKVEVHRALVRLAAP